jgi:hypothetical protein
MTQTTLEPQISAPTCASCPYFQAHNDGTNKGWCGLFDHFARLDHQQTQDCVNTIRDTEEEVIEIDEEVDELLPVFAAELPAGYEIDASYDVVFGKIYRIWYSFYLCGTFYQDEESYWIPQPVKSDFRPRVKSELQAQLIVITVYENPCLQTDL